MPSIHQSHRNVVIFIDLSRASRRDILSGIFDAMNVLGEWNVRIIQTKEELSSTTVRGWEIQNVDGVILVETSLPDVDEALLNSPIPLVVIGSHGRWLRKRHSRVAFTLIDDLSLGRFAARECLKLGAFSSAAFIPSDDNGWWSRLRGRGFAAVTRKAGIPTVIYNKENDGDAPKFIRNLEKPAIVFAACDRIIVERLGTRPETSCGIPRRTVLLGVDDDRLLCESMRPRLSSIHPDHYGLGAQSARALDELMSNPQHEKPKKVLCDKVRLVMRETTVPIAPAAKLVQRAIDFISRNACSGIKVNDVAKAMKVSRRLLDLRFEQFSTRSVADEILKVKLDHVKQSLETTDDSLAAIAADSGFCNSNHLKNIFKSKTGLTLTEWRSAHKR